MRQKAPFGSASVEVPSRAADGGPRDAHATQTASPSAAADLAQTNPSPGSQRALPRSANQPRDPDRYQILGEHGRGGLGRVSRARDCDLGRDVAIKELISRTPTSEVRFLREALITARLEHPSIVPVHEAGRWPDGTPFYAMKLVAGRPLRELIAERLTVEERLELLHHVIAVADAIAYAHGRNIIHRDLKPANVIIGDFGETVVIDWGLAKDLTAHERDEAGGGPFRMTQSDDLTAEGSVLGTPAYMAPEQERGELVDERADVFAIGAMLWELCSLDKVPPTDRALRHRMFRQNGVDADLVTIVDRCLDPDPRSRYHDAGALASDLKAFKAGARLRTRTYSLIALLQHWARRHRSLAFGAVVTVMIATMVAVLYVRNIAIERERADRALRQVTSTQAELAAERDQLLLKTGQLQLATDPTAAIDTLASYHGNDVARAKQLRAEATGSGVASVRAAAHADSILWLAPADDGAVISLGVDGTVVSTHGNGQSFVLAKDATANGIFSYSPARRLLAYQCTSAHLCLVDVARARVVATPERLRVPALNGVDFSADGQQLAIIDAAGLLQVFDVADLHLPLERWQRRTGDGLAVMFLARDALVVGTSDGLKLVRSSGAMPGLIDPDGSIWDPSADRRELALATTRGEAFVVETEQLHIRHKHQLCQGSITGLRMLSETRLVAFVCDEGTVGTWNLHDDTTKPYAHLNGHGGTVGAAPSGETFTVADAAGNVTVVDLRSEIVTTLRGQGFRITSVASPTRAYPYVLSGDVRGGLRVWPWTPIPAHVVAMVNRPFISAIYVPTRAGLVATTLSPTLTTYSPRDGTGASSTHIDANTSLEITPDQGRFLTYGASSEIELWDATTLQRTKVLHTPHTRVSRVAFATDGTGALSAGREGKVVRWSGSGESSTIAVLPHGIDDFCQAGGDGALVIADRDGALWGLASGQSLRALGTAGAELTALVCVPGSEDAYAATASGAVVAIDSHQPSVRVVGTAAGRVHSLAVSRDGRALAFAGADSLVHATFQRHEANERSIVLPVLGRRLAITARGVLVVLAADGRLWIYSRRHDAYAVLPIAASDLKQVIFDDREETAFVLDAAGRITSIDLKQILITMDSTMTREEK